MANLADLSLRLLCLFSPSPLLAARAEDWQKLGTWVHSLTEAGYAGDPKPEEFSRSGEANKDWESGRRQAMWLAQAGFSVSDDGVQQLAERETRAPEERGNILVGRVVVGQPGGGFQPSRIHSLTESAFAGRGGEGGVELQQMESVFQPSQPDHQHKNDDEWARESSRIKQNDFLATRYYPRQDDAQPKSGRWKLQGGKVKYLLADAANHTYLKLPVKELLRRLQSNKHLLREQIMERQDTKATKLSN